jgi:hypothetical protein
MEEEVIINKFDKDIKFLMEWVEGYSDAPSKIVSLHDIKIQDVIDGDLLKDGGTIDELEETETEEVVIYTDPSGMIKFTRV